MKIILLLVVVSIIALIGGCSDCDGENPSVRLVNSGTDVADIQIKTSGGNTENINGVEPGSSSERREFAPGDIEFTISIRGEDEPIVYNLKVSHCMDYIVTINGDNSVSSSSTERD